MNDDDDYENVAATDCESVDESRLRLAGVVNVTYINGTTTFGSKVKVTCRPGTAALGSTEWTCGRLAVWMMPDNFRCQGQTLFDLLTLNLIHLSVETGAVPIIDSQPALQSIWRRGSVVRTSLFGWRTFADLRLTDGHFVGKVTAMGLPTRPTQPFIPPGSVNE